MNGEQPGLVIVRGATDGFVQEITAGPHHLRSDEPTAVGGTDTGPTPYDLLLGALALARRAFAIPTPTLRIVRRARHRMRG